MTQQLRTPAVLEMQDTQVRSLSQEDPLEEEMATHSSILAWGIPWTEEPGGLQSMGSLESDMTKQISTEFNLYFGLMLRL